MTIGNIRPDQFYGKPFATAVQEFLQIKGSAASAEEILEGMQSGGFDFKGLGWKEKDWLRSLSMSISKNTHTFHRLPNKMYGLVDWYPSVKSKRAGKDQDKSNGSSSDDDSKTEAGEGAEP